MIKSVLSQFLFTYNGKFFRYLPWLKLWKTKLYTKDKTFNAGTNRENEKKVSFNNRMRKRSKLFCQIVCKLHLEYLMGFFSPQCSLSANSSFACFLGKKFRQMSHYKLTLFALGSSFLCYFHFIANFALRKFG